MFVQVQYGLSTLCKVYNSDLNVTIKSKTMLILCNTWMESN